MKNKSFNYTSSQQLNLSQHLKNPISYYIHDLPESHIIQKFIPTNESPYLWPQDETAFCLAIEHNKRKLIEALIDKSYAYGKTVVQYAKGHYLNKSSVYYAAKQAVSTYNEAKRYYSILACRLIARNAAVDSETISMLTNLDEYQHYIKDPIELLYYSKQETETFLLNQLQLVFFSNPNLTSKHFDIITKSIQNTPIYGFIKYQYALYNSDPIQFCIANHNEAAITQYLDRAIKVNAKLIIDILYTIEDYTLPIWLYPKILCDNIAYNNLLIRCSISPYRYDVILHFMRHHGYITQGLEHHIRINADNTKNKIIILKHIQHFWQNPLVWLVINNGSPSIINKILLRHHNYLCIDSVKELILLLSKDQNTAIKYQFSLQILHACLANFNSTTYYGGIMQDLDIINTLITDQENPSNSQWLIALDRTSDSLGILLCNEEVIKHKKVVDQLLMAQANCNVYSDHSIGRLYKDGATPLHVAAYYNQKEVIISLLDAGADIDAETYDEHFYSYSALCFAISNNSYGAATYLMLQGADANTININPTVLAKINDIQEYKEYFADPLAYLVRHGAYEDAIIKTMKKLPPENSTKALSLAIQYQRASTIEKFIDLHNINYNQALLAASAANNEILACRLIARGAKPIQIFGQEFHNYMQNPTKWLFEHNESDAVIIKEFLYTLSTHGGKAILNSKARMAFDHGAENSELKTLLQSYYIQYLDDPIGYYARNKDINGLLVLIKEQKAINGHIIAALLYVGLFDEIERITNKVIEIDALLYTDLTQPGYTSLTAAIMHQSSFFTHLLLQIGANANVIYNNQTLKELNKKHCSQYNSNNNLIAATLESYQNNPLTWLMLGNVKPEIIKRVFERDVNNFTATILQDTVHFIVNNKTQYNEIEAMAIARLRVIVPSMIPNKDYAINHRNPNDSSTASISTSTTVNRPTKTNKSQSLYYFFLSNCLKESPIEERERNKSTESRQRTFSS